MSGSDSVDVGWLYCFENPCMPGIYKIGMTTRTPEERLADANAAETWKPPLPYQIVLTRYVSRVRELEKTVHSLLEELGMRVHPRREFFRVSRSVVEKVFTLVGPAGGGWDGDVIEHVGEEDDVIEHVADTYSEKVVLTESKCPQCGWNGRSSRFPYHLISRHLSQIEQLRSIDGHCVFIKLNEIECYCCLTCKKGTTHTSVGRVGKRWCGIHKKQQSCCEKHPTEFESIQKQWETIVGVEDDDSDTSVPTVECICCDWTGLSHRFPKHALRYHTDSIKLSPKQFENCAVCYLVSGTKRTMFTACLGCEKGTTASPYCGNGARWVTRHDTVISCSDKHKEFLAEAGFPTID